MPKSKGKIVKFSEMKVLNDKNKYLSLSHKQTCYKESLKDIRMKASYYL
jgi:hypothetical protein